MKETVVRKVVRIARLGIPTFECMIISNVDFSDLLFVDLFTFCFSSAVDFGDICIAILIFVHRGIRFDKYQTVINIDV